MKSPILFLLSIIPLSTLAQITTDGTLGQALNLPGPSYQITPDLGQQHSGNLFHSFKDFNLQRFESATFSGPDTVQNVISRVTGGHPSHIDGLFRSTIAGAAVYFLNPYGIMFGPNARLDVQGSFHASTADYLLLGEGGRFVARHPSNSLLTVAPVKAFGFLTPSPAPLSIESSQLTVPLQSTLSLIGGQLTLHKAQLTAPFGRINLASIAESGEVIPTFEEFVDPSLRGDITISDQSLITVSGNGSGSIFIRGGRFVAENSAIEAKTLGSQDGGMIDLQANTVSLTQGATLNGNTEGTGNGSSIEVRATDSITVAGENAEHTQESSIFARSGTFELTDENLGDTGNIYLQAKNIVIEEGGGVSTSTHTAGNGGKVTIKASEMILVTGDGMRWTDNYDGSYVASATYGNTENAGKAGDIWIEAKNISFAEGSYIYSSSEGLGQGGQITLKADEMVSFSGEQNGSDSPTRINIDTMNEGGDAGYLLIDAQNILFEDGANIDSATIGKGQGGSITLNAVDKIILNNSRIFGSTAREGNAGSISIEASEISLNGSRIFIDTHGEGNAGLIVINADNIDLTNYSWISSDTLGKGNADQISVAANNISLNASRISSDTGSEGNAGLIVINANNIDLTNDSWISSDTLGEGNADQISITANNISLNESRISSDTYEEGNAGQIIIKNTGTVTVAGANATYNSRISSDTGGTGNAGHISIETRNLFVEENGYVYSSAFGPGHAGQIDIHATGTVSVVGATGIGGWASAIASASNPKEPGTVGGQGGDLMIEAKELIITDGGYIAASSIAPEGTQSSPGGNITIRVSGAVTLSGVNPYGENEDGFGAGIYVRSIGKNARAAGTIELSAGSVTIQDGAVIESSTDNTAPGGNIQIDVNGPVHISGDASQIELLEPSSSQEDYLQQFSPHTYNQSTSGIYASSKGLLEPAEKGSNTDLTAQNLPIRGGDAGTITITAGDSIYLSNGGRMTTQAESAGGGQITLKTAELLRIVNGEISSSVQYGAGNGGNLKLNPQFIVLENGKILARAYEGDGGNMNITTTGIYRFGDETANPIDASSKLGIDGEIVVNSPDTDVSGLLLVLSTEMLNAADQMQPPCSSRIAENMSSLAMVPSEGTSNAPDDLLPSGPYLSKLKPAKSSKSSKGKSINVNSLPLMVARTNCKPAPAAVQSSVKSQPDINGGSVLPEQLF